jgi:hypothetical protein
LNRPFSLVGQNPISRPASPDWCIPEPFRLNKEASKTGIFSRQFDLCGINRW